MHRVSIVMSWRLGGCLSRLGLPTHLGGDAVGDQHGEGVVGDEPSLGAMNNNPRTSAVAQFFIVQHFVKPAGAAAALDMALYPVIGPASTLGEYRCRVGLEFRDGPALAAIGTEEYGVRGEAGKVVFKPGFRRITVQTIEQCVDGLVVLLQVLCRCGARQAEQ